MILKRTGRYISPDEAASYTVNWIADINQFLEGVQYYIDKNATSEGD